MLGIREIDIIAPMGLKNRKGKRVDIPPCLSGGDQVAVCKVQRVVVVGRAVVENLQPAILRPTLGLSSKEIVYVMGRETAEMADTA